MAAFWTTMSLILIAEIADKTQLVALALAARYRLSQVVVGIVLAVMALGLVAVLLGEAVTKLVPMAALKGLAGLAFFAFAAWALLSKEPKQKKRNSEKSAAVSAARKAPTFAFAAVAAAFFLAEFGDKTQLAAVVLAARYASPAAVWAGFVSGMVLADALGLAIGRVLGARMPGRALAVSSAVVFTLFGLVSLFDAAVSA